MRTIKGQGFPQDGNDVKWPDGQIRNETLGVSGTPVVRELYGDIVTNVYKILRYAGVEPTETEDGENTQYQLLEALKKFANELNDIQQVVTVDDLVMTVVFNFDSLPDDYVFIAKVTEDVIANEDYEISGSGDKTYNLMTPVTIPASSLVLVTLNEDGCSISQLNSNLDLSGKYISTPFGTPLSFNDSNRMLYYSDGILFDDAPRSFLIRNRIQTFAGSLNVEICDVIFHKKRLICLTLDTNTLEYKIYCFSDADLNTVLGASDIALSNADNNVPYMYCDGDFVYFSNSTAEVNDSANDNDFAKFRFDANSLEFVYVTTFDIDASFQKTTNVFLDGANAKLFTFISGELISYEFGTAVIENLGFFNTLDGVVFKFNKYTYYSNGEISTRWQY